ncbi:MAG: S41 family peptidase [Treponema sp.]|jgi:carboxyl-terminal processing protease|nr:S41 family peptidase [Treponema sp.]
MSDTGFSPEHRPSRFKQPLSWVWIVATAALCVIFALASVPGVLAQGRDGGNQIQGQSAAAGNTRKYTSIIQNVFDFIQRHYVEEVDPKIIFEGAMTGMFNALGDPYSSFLPESEMSDLNDTTQGSFGGVGLYISKPIGERSDGKPPYVEVASPIEDTPGWRAGINPGDLIIEIDGEATDKLTMDEVLARLRGTPEVNVNLIIRRGEKLEFPVTLTRAVIEVPTAKHAMIGETGYLKLLTFTPMTADRARAAINEFTAQNYKSMVLDLRNNYGGLLNSAVDISSLFLEGGVVVSTKSRIPSENHVFNARRTPMVAADIPLIVLINRGSASASEIVAGALKDRGRAYLVGEKSYGKGSVQQVYPLDTAGFKITTARYFTPSDVNIDKIGIPPDREVKFPEFTDADAEKLNSLINTNKIPSFVKENPKAGAAQIDSFAAALEKEYRLDITLLKRLIRNEQNRTTIAPVYDIEYDVQLQEAVNILKSGKFRALMQTTKTLKDLQEEAGDLALAS